MRLSRRSLLTIYKSFVRPLLDYADIIYDKPYNESFKEKLEAVQYDPKFFTKLSKDFPLHICKRF